MVVYGGHDMFRPLMYQLKNRLDARVLSIDQARLIGSEAVLVKNFSLKEKNTYLVKTDKKNGIDFYLFESNGSFFSNSPDYAYDLGEIKVNIERFFYPGVTFIEIYIMPISEGAIPIFTSSKNKKRKDLTIPNGEYIVWQLDNAGQLLNVEWINTASKEE